LRFACNGFEHRCKLRYDFRIDLIGFRVGTHTASWLLADLQSHEYTFYNAFGTYKVLKESLTVLFL
jgi:hypothetical protein